MKSRNPIGRTLFAALALASLAVACGDDSSPTKLADQTREPNETEINPWTTILASAATLGGPATVAFPHGHVGSYRVRALDPSTATPQDGPQAFQAVCVVADANDRADLDGFRRCMARALREDVCRSGGAFVLYRPDANAPGRWRAVCPTAQEVDDEDDDGSRVSRASRLSATYR